MRLKKESMRQVKDAAVSARQENDPYPTKRPAGGYVPPAAPPPGMMYYRGALVKRK